MNKKDRIAISISVVLSLIALFLVFGGPAKLSVLFLTIVVIAIYWGYRFVKGDISFIDSKWQK